MRIWSVCVLAVLVVDPSSGELYSSVSEMQALHDTEAFIIALIDHYVKLTEEKLSDIKRNLAEYRKEYATTIKQEEFLENPIYAFLSMKRVTKKLDYIQQLMFSDDTSNEIKSLLDKIKSEMPCPTAEDLIGSLEALDRLQNTYGLDASSLANGIIKGVRSPLKLSAKDCYEIGMHSYKNQDFYHTKQWMEVVLEMFTNEKDTEGVDFKAVLEHLAYSSYKEGDLSGALNATNKLLELDPENPRALNNKKHYVAAIENNDSTIKENDKHSMSELTDNELYQLTCRKEITQSTSVTSKLKCKYVHYNNPFLRLAPLKVEEASLDPQILLFRNIITESEVECLKEIGQTKLTRSQVESLTGVGMESKSRISKQSWLTKSDTPIVDRLNRRVEDMTSMTTETAESLQVANYGIGGYYAVHLDSAQEDDNTTVFNFGAGNRIATVLFYLSDVTEGGATVFPRLRLAVWPEKGTALYWNNLHSDGQVDLNSQHAGCPVLIGSKWIGTIWLHERGQEFRKPCGLRPHTP